MDSLRVYNLFPGSANTAGSPVRRSPAASSRWSPSAARCSTRRSCSATKSALVSRPSSFAISMPGCRTSLLEEISLVVVEQDIVQALKTARHVYCLQEGRVSLEGDARTLTRETISAAYFGV